MAIPPPRIRIRNSRIVFPTEPASPQATVTFETVFDGHEDDPTVVFSGVYEGVAHMTSVSINVVFTAGDGGSGYAAVASAAQVAEIIKGLNGEDGTYEWSTPLTGISESGTQSGWSLDIAGVFVIQKNDLETGDPYIAGLIEAGPDLQISNNSILALYEAGAAAGGS